MDTDGILRKSNAAFSGEAPRPISAGDCLGAHGTPPRMVCRAAVRSSDRRR